MKRTKYLSIIALIVMFMFTGCKTPKPLDLTTLEDNKFYLNEIVLMINEDVDVDSIGEKFITTTFPELLEEIEKGIDYSHGIEINYTDFLTKIAEGSISIAKEVKDYGFVVHVYAWTNDKSYNQQVGVLLPFSINEDNKIRATLAFSKGDPNSSNIRVSDSVSVELQVAQNN